MEINVKTLITHTYIVYSLEITNNSLCSLRNYYTTEILLYTKIWLWHSKKKMTLPVLAFKSFDSAKLNHH